MVISFNPQISTRNLQFTQLELEKLPTQTKPEQPIKEEQKPGFVRRAAAGTAYTWINVSEGLKGVFNGLTSAFICGTLISGFDWIKTGSKKVKNKEIKFVEMFKTPRKALGKWGKIYAPIAAAVLFVGNLISARLRANKRTADVDHQLKVKHRESPDI